MSDYVLISATTFVVYVNFSLWLENNWGYLAIKLRNLGRTFFVMCSMRRFILLMASIFFSFIGIVMWSCIVMKFLFVCSLRLSLPKMASNDFDVEGRILYI